MESADHGGPQEHARVSGSPGERPRLAGLLLALWPILLIVAAGGYLLRAALPAPPLGTTLVGVLFLALGVALAYALTASRQRLEAFFKGARGEERVAHTLAFLPSGYHVFHGLAASSRSLAQQARDYDHLVVGPRGVFLVETKNWVGQITASGGAIRYDGQTPSRDPLRQARRAAQVMQAEIREACGCRLAVHPIVCFAANTVAEGRFGVDGVVVCNRDVLNEQILDPHNERLPDDVRVRVEAYLARRLAQTS